MNEIVFKHVNVLYENNDKQIVTAIDDLSLVFPAHKVNVIVGYSGSGKTSLIKCLTGHLIYEGQILFDDVDLEKIELKDRKISFVSQDIILYPRLNVYENIIFPLKTEKKIDYDLADQKVKSIAKELDIDYLLTRNIKYLSIGQKSRVQLAKALVKDNELYVLDEFTKSLDPAISRDILEKFINMIKDNNKTIVCVTHNIEEALNIADNIYVLNEGKVVGVYTPMEFIQSDNEIVKSLLVK